MTGAKRLRPKPLGRPPVTVVTVTHARPASLLRALASVARQQGVANVEHLIIGDACPNLAGLGEHLTRLFPSVRWVNVMRDGARPSVGARLSALRNLGVGMAAADWIAFLDDDNVFMPHHLVTLLETARHRAVPAVHSHRLLIEPDGTLFDGERFPWPCGELQPEEALVWARSQSLLRTGCAVMRDRALLKDGRFGTVDTSEWLVRRSLASEQPWPEDVSAEQESLGLAEDGRWLHDLVHAAVPIETSTAPTLLFRLGGRLTASQIDRPAADA